MLSFLFWNVNRKPVEDTISQLASTHEVDVLILAECLSSPAALLGKLAEGGGDIFHFPSSRCEKIHIYTRFSTDFLIPIPEANRQTIRRLRLPAKTEILLTATHSRGKLHSTGHGQTIDCTELARSISEAEEEVGHTRTVLVGDFNMNPFEAGVVAAGGLHAAMTRQIASESSRIVQQRRYPYFYNPMWSYFGDGSEGPPAPITTEAEQELLTFGTCSIKCWCGLN